MNLADVKCPECGHSLEDHFNTLIAGDECRENGCTCDKSREEILLAALNAKQAELDAYQWRPIEEAPKDGTPVLLGYFNRCNKWRWVKGRYFDKRQIDDEWEEPDGDEGWYETPEELDDPPNCFLVTPTHYMPLPQPPKEVAE